MSSAVEADAALLFGRVWMERGKPERAAAHLERALALRPAHPETNRWMAYLRLHQEAFADAARYLTVALADESPDSPEHDKTALLRQLAGEPPEPLDLPDAPGGRLRLVRRRDWSHHRSGWGYAWRALSGLHHRGGIRFEDFLEDPFAWQHPHPGIRSGPELLKVLRGKAPGPTSEERRLVPIRESWVGILHNPPHMPAWFHPQESPRTILAKSVWRASLPACLGLFTLSAYAADWLRAATGKPVSALPHPTETPALTFDWERFQANPHKRVIQVGWWLRRLSAIDRLPIPQENPLGLGKLRLMPRFFDGAGDYLGGLHAAECQRDGAPDPAHGANTEVRQHVPDAEFDRLLAENIGFVSLYDASANNAVVECLVRATPLLVNPLPAVREYLGDGYPLYYADLAEASALAQDLGRLKAAHEWLRERSSAHPLDAAAFRRAVVESEVYQRLIDGEIG